MKMTLESPSRMVLKDNNYTQFVMGFVFFLVGAGVAFLFMSEGLVPVAIGAVFALAGLYLIAITKIVTVTLDKGANKGTVSLRGIIGGGTRDFELAKVKKVVLRKTVSSTSSSKGSSSSYHYIVGLVMEGGEELPFELATVSANITDVLVSPDERQKEAAKRISDFLGLQLEWVPAPSLMDALAAMKEGIEQGMERAAKKSG